MGKGSNKKKKRTPSKTGIKEKKKQPMTASALDRIEFHRHAMALMPDPGDRRPGIAYFVQNHESEPRQRFCTCSISRTRTCPHLLELTKAYKTLHKGLKGKGPYEDFRASIWRRLGAVIAGDARGGREAIRVQSSLHGDGRVVRVLGPHGEDRLHYLSQGPDQSRFIERCLLVSQEDAVPNRGSVLEKLALLTLTKNERAMMDRGFKTRGQVFEESFWHRVAYHGYRELGANACSFEPAIEETTGLFTVACKNSRGDPLFRLVIPRDKVRSLLTALEALLPNQHGMAIHPVPLKSIFKVTMDTQLDLQLRPLIQVLQESGEAMFFEREDLERFQYGDLVYIKELGIIAELEKPGRMARKFRSPQKMVLKKSQIPSFLEEFGADLVDGPHLVDASVKELKVFTAFDRVEISPEAIDRDWCWLSVMYGFGNMTISLAEIMRARKEGQRYLGAREGWVDIRSVNVDGLDALPDRVEEGPDAGESGSMPLTRMDLFRISATNRPLDVTGKGRPVALVKKMLELEPLRPLPKLKGMKGILRPYQKRGVEWIRFLFENRLGGLLCDDMGLGKTHEVMSFMVGLREHEKARSPFIVICPTTVLSHWSGKIKEYAPCLKAAVYHGGDRNLEEALKTSDVLLTSYGILRRDIDKLKDLPFALAVFDEIQYIKNPQTHAYKAGKSIKADMKLGLTGTPIENRLSELKALLDLTLPGYLGPDSDFETRYVKPIEFDPDTDKREELSRLISPFTLRRLKERVLSDLPEKIEDIRTCMLSEDQVKLYRDAISSRGKGLLKILKKGEEPVPYMHIFALLNLLKQICNHPAMVEGALEDYERYESGKWELFKELISQCLDSGQKVVVYSQYLGMIKIIGQFLEGLGPGFVTLTGASRKRGDIIERFNNDPECRIYVGSLKAGGTGIDLVAASVVIHYDRWWNAAKEDQATDRVHRIGQKRGVHVFKLVTEGTLEEKISAIIEKKRNLMDSVVKESDPEILRTFSREELMDLLSAP